MIFRVVILHIALLLCSSLSTQAQSEVGYLFADQPDDSIQNQSLRYHSSLKPLIRLSSNQGSPYSAFSPLADLNFIQEKSAGYKAGLGIEYKASFKDKWYVRIAGVQGAYQIDSSIFEPKSYLQHSLTSTSLYTDIRSRVSYTPNHIFNFQVGLDHNFIGQGSRSLLLSDYGTPYPFGLIRANFWRFEYSVLYQFHRERDNNRWEGKFSSSHHISFNAAKWLNIGIFETVIFQPADTLLNRGFDVEYLNPFVFYRPQEYSLGSSDNVLIGLDLSAKIKQFTIYSQLILDEFLLSEIRNRSRWWANKYGAQLGIKGQFKQGKHYWFARGEFNFVRPYTYAHLSEELNYGNQGDPLAHPYGANFAEALFELKWKKEKYNAELFVSYYLQATNRDGFNYGSDIFEPYINRPYEYGHTIGQGSQFNGVNLKLRFSRAVIERGNIHAFVEFHARKRTIDPSTAVFFVAGLRSMLWNDYRNY